jgi:hypothetical protein
VIGREPLVDGQAEELRLTQRGGEASRRKRPAKIRESPGGSRDGYPIPPRDRARLERDRAMELDAGAVDTPRGRGPLRG